ncbi:FtsH protease activity modulator HflK [Terasakiella pusilla]|uniref:FtsH protease activity modulator HflK n=1 Tax=Terasakiella pusilla TaxID=64973 RepID=UPI003AA7B4AE
MSWNNQGGGPWGGGGNNQGPWGQGPKRPNGGGNGGGGPTPPDLEEMLRKSQESMKKFLPGGMGGGKLVVLGLIIILAIWIASGFYRVNTNQQGVQLLFGKYVSSTSPGLHWNFPAPIGDVLTPQVTNVRKIEIGVAGQRSRGSDVGESLMLTGDQNIADVEFAVLWNVKDAASFLFNIRDPETTVRAASQSAMREVIGQMSLEKINTEGRGQIAQEAEDLIQQILDDYKSGINITGVELDRADPPQAVIEAFNDVQSARQDKERKQNEAEAYRNKIVPTARGEAQKLIQEAEAYKERVIKDAEGEANRFQSVYESYVVNKDVTRERLYLETMQDVLKGSEKVIIDSQQGSNGVVPYLPLPELQKRNKGAQ